ncbi:MAG: alanine racemase, partial [Brachybacterium sp.]|nr:alanine racemase [Brachybacterium sp.]
MPEHVPSTVERTVEPAIERTVQPRDKSFPAELLGRPITALEAPLSTFSTPLLVLDESAIAHNLRVMERWTRERGLELMPHGKTTMAPALWARQLAAGCTGITVATGWQADIALRAGIPTVQLAHTCTDPALLRRLAAHLAEHPEQELVCWADSLATVELLERELPAGSSLGVLVELGADGARTGARDEATAREIGERVAASAVLRLVGAAGYEGALAHDRSPASLTAVSDYCERLAALAETLRPLVAGTPWVSAGGSA